MPLGIDDNYNGVPNEAEPQGGDTMEKVRALLQELVALIGPAGDPSEMPVEDVPSPAPGDETGPENAEAEAPLPATAAGPANPLKDKLAKLALARGGK